MFLILLLLGERITGSADEKTGNCLRKYVDLEANNLYMLIARAINSNHPAKFGGDSELARSSSSTTLATAFPPSTFSVTSFQNSVYVG